MNNRIYPRAGLLLVLAGVGCAADAAGPEVEQTADQPGSLQVALQQQGADGAVYYLRDARLRLTGQLDTTIEVDESPVLTHALPQGQYAMELLEGWWMERERAGELREVEADLLSPNPLGFSISPGKTTAVTLRFRIEGGGDVAFETGDMVVDMQVEPAPDAGAAADAQVQPAADAAQPACQGRLVINEVDYDQPDADDGEFIELFNPSDCPVSTEGLRLNLINGANGQAVVYGGADLSEAGPAIPPGGYLVAGSAGVVAALAKGVPAIAISASIQNGDPDGIVLGHGEDVLDSLSYGGNIPGVTETESAPTDVGQGSIGRCENGVDSDDNAADFLFSDVPTPGAENHCTPI
jgi:hypothetical protein